MFDFTHLGINNQESLKKYKAHCTNYYDDSAIVLPDVSPAVTQIKMLLCKKNVMTNEKTG